MASFRLHARRLFDGKNYLDDHVMTIENGIIVAIDQNLADSDHLVEGLVVPGFIDLQVNGGGGKLFNDRPSLANINAIITAHVQYGTTALLPTLITDKVEVMAQAADAIAQAMALRVPGVVGIHFEGPHLSAAKKGAHIAEYIRPISGAEWRILERQDIGQVIVTLAPETVHLQDIVRMVSLGIKVCLGHTNANYLTTQQALDAGADGFTHLFNAMSPLQAREAGVTGCALLNDRASCGLIVDGHHVDYAVCKLALKAKPPGSVFLVTDAMPLVGTSATEFTLLNRQVFLNEGKLNSTTGELAGSMLNMAQAVANTHRHLDLPLDEAIRMATQYPAHYINQSSIRGSLAIGSQADMVLLSKQLKVIKTWIAGECVYTKYPKQVKQH